MGTDQLIVAAKAGDDDARNELIRAYTPFVLKVASRVCGRFLHAGQDEEISIGLLAFNEAIDRFDATRGHNFIAFAETVIRRRLIDHFRKQSAARAAVPFSDLETEDDEGHPISQVDVQAALDRHALAEEAWERRQEILRLQQELAQFGIRFSDLVKSCPKHKDARDRAIQVARRLATVPAYREALVKNRTLPLRELAADPLVKASRKTLERQRKYIVAVALILMGDYVYLQEYVA
ncbi:RNA polymerase sigma factor SigI [Thermaerobacter marianensis]|uniref:RNA polymerase sigma factor SigI n=1 Tax=Thermaerobacter marianensis TaxID=73919 RepID=UPI001FA7DBB4|nr:RNA polymerase sigma factor SigI [Thermaerobacter marianensis]